jgi:alginate O-acetyltransferase complex protein AlgI
MIQYASYWLWLAVSVAVHWALPLRWRLPFVGLTCLAFLAVQVPETVALMLPICLAVYLAMNLPIFDGRRRLAFRVSLVLLLGFLGYYKYLPAIEEALGLTAAESAASYPDAASLFLPIGISYFTFKLIHYAIERGRNTLPAHNLGDYLAYVFLVPIFTAGPIERLDGFVANRQTYWSNTLAVEGLTRIGYGLIKKFVIGAAIFMLMQRLSHNGGPGWILDNLSDVGPAHVAAFLILTYLYVYMDFAGYTDIALGCSRLFGLRIMENFNLPILAPNIGNLWKRWHMSLANWCQTYVYMPMIGVTRNPYLAVLSSFTVMGLWHGAGWGWLAWGWYNALGVIAFQAFSTTARRRKWGFVRSRAFLIGRYPLTFLFFAGSFAFTFTADSAGVWGGVRLLLRCFGPALPAW